MRRALLFTLCFHDGRYHGVPDWPPSPARLFQALVAGAAGGQTLSPCHVAALTWLETLDAPSIGAPAARRGNAFTNFVPNNDLDAVGRDPKRTAEIRAAKLIRPQLFDAAIPLLYLWSFEPTPEAEGHAAAICAIAERLYQLGRGVDMAWAFGEVLDTEEGEARLAMHRGPIHRPTLAASKTVLSCPTPGALDSLVARHKANGARFSELREKRNPTQQDPRDYKVIGTTFAQAPKPRFRQIAYDCPPELLLFDLRDRDGEFVAFPQTRIAELVKDVRDAVAAKLKQAYENANKPADAAQVAPVFIGRNAVDADKATRISIIPLPSIGHPQVSRAIRRVLVRVPPNCPIPAEDIGWAFSGAENADPDTGELTDVWRLTPAVEHKMLEHYGASPAHQATLWRTVTPLALTAASRRRIDPKDLAAEARRPPTSRTEVKNGAERAGEEFRAAGAVLQALRQAGIAAGAEVMMVQREPFVARESRAELFAPGTRFAKECLWHATVRFSTPITGPLVAGDGRYMGLGLFAPALEARDIIAFQVLSGLAPDAQATDVTSALRRAVMARVRDHTRNKDLPLFFTGHRADGGPACSDRHAHIAFAFDKVGKRLFIFAPHALEHTTPIGREKEHWREMVGAMEGLITLRAGKAGVLVLELIEIDADDMVTRPAQSWKTLTPYTVNRHLRRASVEETLLADIRASCLRLGLPAPAIEVLPLKGQSGVTGDAKLMFPVAVHGPILIGKTRHFGGGFFGPHPIGRPGA